MHILIYNMFNIAKNEKGESANKLTTSKSIAYKGQMLTNNMINSKSSKYPCFRIYNVDAQIIDWICNWLKLIFQYEPNEHHNKTQNQTPHKTTNNTTPHSDDEITQKKWKLDMCENHLFKLKVKRKRCRLVILGKKNDIKPPLLYEWRRKKT
jgi:hypothetical protein